MSSPIPLIKRACDELSIPYTEIEKNFFVQLHFGKHSHNIIFSTMGINPDVDSRVMRDKYCHYQILSKHIAMPETHAYMDPDPPYDFLKIGQLDTLKKILNDVETYAHYPMIVKCNSGTKGRHVYKCDTLATVKVAFENIFSKQQIEYDHFALVQSYILPKHEYRVMVFNGKIEIIHYKQHTQDIFCGSKNHIQWSETHSDYIEPTQHQALIQFAQKINHILPIRYCGYDIIEDENGKFWLIEINGSPLISDTIPKQYQTDFYQLYLKIVRYLKTYYALIESTEINS